MCVYVCTCVQSLKRHHGMPLVSSHHRRLAVDGRTGAWAVDIAYDEAAGREEKAKGAIAAAAARGDGEQAEMEVSMGVSRWRVRRSIDRDPSCLID